MGRHPYFIHPLTLVGVESVSGFIPKALLLSHFIFRQSADRTIPRAQEAIAIRLSAGSHQRACAFCTKKAETI
jgi:hypothetical protein